MPSLLSRYQHDASSRSSLILPLALLLACAVSFATTSSRHSLLTNAFAWGVLCVLFTLRTGPKSLLNGLLSQRLAWTAGGALVIAQVCERAAQGKTLWWAKALPPISIFTFVRGGLLDTPLSFSLPESPTSTEKPSHVQPPGSRATLLVLTFAGVTTLHVSSGSIATTALGLSHSLLTVAAFHLIAKAYDVARVQAQSGGGVIYSARGLYKQPVISADSDTAPIIALGRDVSVAALVASAIAAVALEGVRIGDAPDRAILAKAAGYSSEFGAGVQVVVFALAALITPVIMYGVIFLMIHRQGAFLTSLVPLSAAVCLQLLSDLSLFTSWFALLYGVSIYIFLDESDVSSSGSRLKARGSRILSFIAILSLLILGFHHIWQPYQASGFDSTTSSSPSSVDASSPALPLDPLQYTNQRAHPMYQILQERQKSWDTTVRSQSQTLDAAVAEYKRRYGILPPPNFDKWYNFAKQRGAQMIDEYDSVYHSLLPFWALTPAAIRGRAREALGYGGNQLMGLIVRDGQMMRVEGGQDWLQDAVVGMVKPFVEELPDMDLAFNLHDEPRVVIPHDELSRLVQVALTERLRKAQANTAPKNFFSPRPKDLGNGKRIEEVKQTRFNIYDHQPTWIPSRLSCSPESPARPLEDTFALDNLTAYALGELGFVYNLTAFSDVCNSPSFSKSHGFFNGANSFNVVHDLFPIFSQSKMSSFQDILFPSPWYWSGKVPYEPEKDKPWVSKFGSLWWRGSTTGGYSREGGWRRQHRQQLVMKLNALDTARVYTNGTSAADTEISAPRWQLLDVPRQNLADLVDVHFTSVGQCEPNDCHAQKEFYDIVEVSDHQDAWQYKYLLDMDGNAFSGRFYSFLQSRSLTFKMAVFREWHEEWIKPWVHYIPLSLRGNEALEAVRYFDVEKDGQAAAAVMADTSREWAGKVLRKEDAEVWLFRLLLEYGRIIDDNRESIGFTGA